MFSNNNIQKAIEIFGLAPDSEVKSITNGVNSNVFIIGDPSKKYVLKFYRKDNNSPTRLEREISALEIFRLNGIKNVPQLLNHSKELNCSLLSFIPGENISKFSQDYIIHFQTFFKKILSLSYSIDKQTLNLDAIDSCMEIDTVNNQIEARITNFKKENNVQINTLLSQIEEIFQIIAQHVKMLNNSFNKLKPILSPVDFGINNVLIMNKEVHFIDFEFFGWDNPIHLISDTISHPANNLNISEQAALLDAIVECYTVPEEQEEIMKTFNGVNLLFDIKWCLIMLNPFLSSYNSNMAQSELQNRQTIQEKKVQNKLALIKYKMENAKFFY